MIKKKKNSAKKLFLPLCYLVLFSITLTLFFVERKDQEEITVQTPFLYSGYDVYEDDVCVGQYYYSFSKEGVQFYLLNPRNTPSFSTPVSLTGTFKPNTEEIKQVQKSLSSITEFSTEELEDLTANTFFLEQPPITTKQWIAIGIACLLALFSIKTWIIYFLHYKRSH